MPAIIGLGSLRDDGQPQLGANLVWQTNSDYMMTEGLDRVLQLDATPVHLVAELGQRFRDIVRRDRAEQLAFLTRLPAQSHRHGAEGRCKAFRLSALRRISIGPRLPLRGDTLP